MSDAEIRLLRNRAITLTEALEIIAKQKLGDEMDQETRECADWKEGYEACILKARATLKTESY